MSNHVDGEKKSFFLNSVKLLTYGQPTLEIRSKSAVCGQIKEVRTKIGPEKQRIFYKNLVLYSHFIFLNNVLFFK